MISQLGNVRAGIPGGPHSHILMMGGPSDFFGSEILAKSDFLGSIKCARFFKKTDFFGLRKKD